MELIQKQYEGYTLLLETEQQREESCEVIVPDTLPDVYGVLAVYAQCQLKQKTLRAGALTLEGVIQTQALCQTETEGDYRIVPGSIPFAQEYPLEGCREGDVAELRLEVCSCEGSLRNPRKLQLQARMAVEIQIYQSSAVPITQGLDAPPEDGMELLQEETQLELLTAVAEKKLVAADELPLGEEGALLTAQVQWRTEEVRVLTNKVMLRGNAALHAVFFQGSDTRTQDWLIPFSQVLDCPGAEPGDRAEVSCQTLLLQSEIAEGDRRVLSCSVTGCAWAKLTRTVHAPVLRDAYSTRYTSQCRREDCCCPVCRPFEECVPVSETLSGEEPAQRILDVRWSARCGVEEGKLRAELLFRVLYCCPMGRIHCTEKGIRVLSDQAPCAEKLCCRVQVEQLSVQPAGDGKIDLRCTVRLRGWGEVKQSCGQVCACTLDREAPRELPPPGTLVLRTVEPQETPWTIAKAYGSRPREILEANHLDPGGALTPGQLVMIPFKR